MAIDRKTYSQKDWDALSRKLEQPAAKVVCPRCGKEIQFKRIDRSISVKCSSEGCLFGGVRGL